MHYDPKGVPPKLHPQLIILTCTNGRVCKCNEFARVKTGYSSEI